MRTLVFCIIVLVSRAFNVLQTNKRNLLQNSYKYCQATKNGYRLQPLYDTPTKIESDDNSIGQLKHFDVPSPLNSIVDFNVERNSVVYEVSLGREIGLEIVPGKNGLAVVGEVLPGSKAEKIGILPGDLIVASSATAGTKMWSHDSVDGIKSALSTRFVMSASVKIRFERNLNDIPSDIVQQLKVPYYFNVIVKRPIGLYVEETDDKSVVVKRLTPELGAAKTRRIEIGDQVVAMSASWGDRMWEVNSVESFVVGVRMRTDTQLTFRVKRILPLSTYRGQLEAKQVLNRNHQKPVTASSTTATTTTVISPSATTTTSTTTSSSTVVSAVMSPLESTKTNMVSTGSSSTSKSVVTASSSSSSNGEESKNVSPTSKPDVISAIIQDSTTTKSSTNEPMRIFKTISEQIESIKTKEQLSQLWNTWNITEKNRMSAYDLNKMMTSALELEIPSLAIRVFEDKCGFIYSPPDPIQSINKLTKTMNDGSSIEDSSSLYWTTQNIVSATKGSDSTAVSNGSNNSGNLKYSANGLKLIKPNNFICTTAAKAYGRNKEADKALALLSWYEELDNNDPPDIYFLSAILYVCAKEKYFKQAEQIFWDEIPDRNLTYTVATTNSIMYMYARQNRPDDALKVYDMSKRMGLKCTVVTYGVLIKALLRSGRKNLQEASFEVLRSLPDIGISPGIEVYNQFLEHFSATHDFRQTKLILRLMAKSPNKVKPDALSYGYLINCFADAKKPRSALAIYRQMRNSRMPPNAYTYMGVLKALSHLRDGMSSVQVLKEMKEKGVDPDKRHISMAMFTCVVSDMSPLAESIFSSLPQQKKIRPDTAIYSLYIRALLQQGKWSEADIIFQKMLYGKDNSARPSKLTLDYFVQYLMLNQRWSDAKKVIDIIADGLVYTTNSKLNNKQQSIPTSIKAVKKIRGNPNADYFPINVLNLQGTYQAMSIVLGPYSSVVQRLRQEESNRAQRTEMALKGEDSLYMPAVAYESSSILKMDRPSKETLLFLAETTRTLCSLPGGYIQGDFYSELLRALTVEGEPWEAQDLLQYKNKVRTRTDDRDKLNASVELVTRLCNELNKMGKFNPKNIQQSQSSQSSSTVPNTNNNNNTTLV